jgi:hypothetical protein
MSGAPTEAGAVAGTPATVPAEALGAVVVSAKDRLGAREHCGPCSAAGERN